MKKMLHIQSSKTFNGYSAIYLFSYIYLLVLSIFRDSNIINILHISSSFSLLYNISVFFILFINVVLLIMCNSVNKWIVPLVILLAFLIFLFFQIKIVPLSFLIIYLMCCNAQLLNIRHFIKYNLYATIIPFIIVVFLNLIHIIPSITIDYAGADKGNSLGFVHPNNTGDIVMGIISALLIIFTQYFMNKKVKYILCCEISIISLFLTLIFYHITNCRELLYFGVMISFFILFVKSSILKNCVYILLIPLIILFPFLFIFLDYNYNPANSFYLNINRWLSSRIFMQNKILYNYPLTFLRKSKDAPITNGLVNTLTLDNSFLSILEICGIIGLIITGIFILRLALMSIKIKAYIPCILLLALMICGNVESSLFTIYLDGPLLYLVALYVERQRAKAF